VTRQLLTRHGIVTRECVSLDPVPGGFATLYPVLRRLEDTGRVRRGYFVAGLGGAQFAEAGAIDRLRAERDAPETPVVVTLSSTDPANPYGALVEWPRWMDASAVRASRTAGARVVLVDGACVAWIARGDRHLLAALPDEPREQARRVSALARELVRLARDPRTDRPGWLLAEVNGQPAAASPIAAAFTAEGFSATGGGLQLRVPRTPGARHRWDAPEVPAPAAAPLTTPPDEVSRGGLLRTPNA
jgi:ATP-dependent Lhr-like helicase